MKMKRVLRSSLAAFLAAVVAADAFAAAAAAECVSDTTAIFEAEAAVEDPTVGGTRTYHLCADTTFDIGYYDNGAYVDGMPALELTNPNVHVLCGDDGRRENNCAMRGGGLHVFAGSFDGPPLSNVMVSGVTFREVEEKVVEASARTDGEGVLFRDCVFEHNRDVTGLVDAWSKEGDGVSNNDMTLVFDSCTFDSNSAGIPDASLFGLIWNIGHIMKITGCEFTNNEALAGPDDDLFSFLVGNFEEEKPAQLEISDSTFRNNTVSLALVYDEFSLTTASNNVALGNTYFETLTTDQSCDGVARHRVTQPFEVDCEPFSSTGESTAAPDGATTSTATTAAATSPAAGGGTTEEPPDEGEELAAKSSSPPGPAAVGPRLVAPALATMAAVLVGWC